MDDIKIINLDAKDDYTRVADLMYRASDYVKMETGKANNPGFVHSTLNDAPPVCGLTFPPKLEPLNLVKLS